MPEHLSDDDLDALLRFDERIPARAVLRAQAVIALMAVEGLALVDCADLQGRDWREGELRGEPVDPRTGRVVAALVQVTEYRYLLAHGRDRPPTDRAVRELTLRFGAKRGHDHITPQLLRRSWAARAWAAGMDQRTIAKRLGLRHASSVRSLLS